jgi:hypothetical protein
VHEFLEDLPAATLLLAAALVFAAMLWAGSRVH